MPAKVPIIDGKRRCPQCNQDVEIGDFVSYLRKGKITYTWCKPCNRTYANSRSPTVYGLSLVNQKKAIVLKLKTETPCADCGGIFDPVAMDFDHIRGEKRSGISQMVAQSHTVETLQEEIAKCELVCANCHRVRTAKRPRSRAACIAISVSRGGFPVVDQNGVRYDTFMAASRGTGVGISDVRGIISGRLAQCNGFVFCDAKDVTPEKLESMRSVKRHTRAVIDESGIRYASITEASRVTHLDRNSIQRSVDLGLPTRQGHKFRMANDSL